MLIQMIPHQSRSTPLFSVENAPQPVSQIYGEIPAGYRFSIPNLNITAVVTQSFLVQVTPGADGYQVISLISYAYAFGDTPGQAIRYYLEEVVEQLDWLQRHENSLSNSVRHELVCLQQYLRIM